MPGKKKTKLQGLTALGAKLKELRLAANISQMKLAELLGLNPTHGYKYILRLEKGLVPNPTLRTITGYLKACNAGWQDIADILAQIDLTPSPEPKAKTQPLLVAPYQPGAKASLQDRTGIQIGIEKSRISKEKFWQLVQKAIDHAYLELRPLNLSPNHRRAVLTFIRSVCLTIINSQPENLNTRLERLINLWVNQGLDKNLLVRLQNSCLKIFAAEETVSTLLHRQ
uniref:XRE family transcriptional regulator n=1 Tax=candidate division WOR-3 bacterium TaxID=2052148 RepID=A0A7V3PTD5_UNCW3